MVVITDYVVVECCKPAVALFTQARMNELEWATEDNFTVQLDILESYDGRKVRNL